MIKLGRELTIECSENDKQIERDKDSKINEIRDMCQSQSLSQLGMATYLKK